MPAKSKASNRLSPKARETQLKDSGQGKKKSADSLKSTGANSPSLASPQTGEVGHETAQQMMDLLLKCYPDACCELHFKSDFQLLIAVILSAQTTDVTVNKVTPLLFKKFPTAEKLAAAPLPEIKAIIRPTGYYNAKANNIQACARAIVELFGGKVPDNMDDLTRLPGVGRKTANVLLGVAHKIPGWAVDTHVQRLAKRLGLTSESDPARIEQELEKLFPGQDWAQLSITLIWHGRRTCFARNPDCGSCVIKHICPSSLV